MSVKLQHPDHKGKPIEVNADQVPNYESQGWAKVQPKPKPADD